MLEMATPAAERLVGEHDFRTALRHFASGVTIITTQDADGTVHGMTATAFCSLSLSPPLILVAVARGNRCHERVLAARRFGVSILREDQVELSRHFGGQPSPTLTPKFEPLGPAMVVEGALAALACTLDNPLAGGDHSIFVGLVTAASSGQGDPLIHFGGRYRKLSQR